MITSGLNINYQRLIVLWLCLLWPLASLAITSEDYLSDANGYYERGEYKAAILQLKNALRADPDNGEARMLLGKTYNRLGDGPSAAKEFNKARDLGVARDAVLAPLGRAYLMAGQANKLLQVITHVAGDSPQTEVDILLLHGQAYMEMRGQAYLEADRYKMADEKFNKALALQPSNAEGLVGKARIAFHNRDMTGATEFADRAIAEDSQIVDAWIIKGELSLKAGKPQEAAATFQKALDSDPGNIPARKGKTMSLIGLGEYDNALTEADQLLKSYPYLYMAHYLKGLTQYQQHLLSQAQESVLNALKLAPGHLASHLLAGTIYYQMGQLNLAEHHLREYLRQRLRLYLRRGVDDKQIIKLPGDEQITKLLAATLLKLRKPGEAIELLEPGMPAAADDVQYLSLLGSAYLGHGNAVMGLEYLEKAIALAPDSVNIRKQLAVGHLALGEEELAMGELQTAVDLNQGLPQSDVLQVMIHLRNKDFDSALTVAETLTNKMPDSPVPDNLKGAAQLGKKDHQAARDAYEAALKIQPDFLPAHINLAQLDLLANDSAAAKGRYQKVISYDVGNLKALLGLAVLANHEGRADETEQWLKQAQHHHPKSTQLALMLVAHYQRQGKPLEALDLAGTLASTHSRDQQVLKALALSQIQAGEDDAAINTLRSLVEVAPRSPEAHYKLALVQLKREKYKGARRSLQQALTLQPDYPPAQLAIGRLDIVGKNFDAAQDIARDLMQAYPDAYFGYELEGDILLSRQDFRQAAAAYAIASSKASSAPLARKLFQSRSKAGEAESADEALRQWLTSHPEDVLLRGMLATSLQIQGKNPQAIEEYLRVLKQDPDNITALNNVAWLYQDASNPEGLKYAEHAHELAPKRPDITDTLGWLLVQNGDINRGLVLLQEAALMAPNIPDIRYHMVVALDKAGRRDEAREELDRLLNSNKTFADRDKAEALRARLDN